jgi:heat shock protein HslJ
MKRIALLSMVPALGLLGGCQTPAGNETAAAPAATAPTLAELRNATYQGFEEPSGPVTLADGLWEGEPYEPGGASRPSVSFVRDFHVLGDLNGDGVDEAVVLLAQSAGGTGTLVHLGVVGRKGGTLENLATTLIGDRAQIRGVRVEGGRLLVDVLQAGAEDPACCPGELATLGFTLSAKGLEPFESGIASTRLSLATIGETEWVLRSWAWDEVAPGEPEVTLQLMEDRFAGSSGCNRYFAPVKEIGDPAGALEVGPGAGTRMACPDPAGAIEVRFLQQLEGVHSVGFAAGQLMLSYETDGGGGVMLFDGRPPSS